MTESENINNFAELGALAGISIPDLADSAGFSERTLYRWEQGWRILTVWECAVKGRTRYDPTEMLDRIAEWLNNGIIQKNTEGRNGTC